MSLKTIMVNPQVYVPYVKGGTIGMPQAPDFVVCVTVSFYTHKNHPEGAEPCTFSKVFIPKVVLVDRNGIQPMFCAITNKSYMWPGYKKTYGLGYSELVHSKYCPSLPTAESIHKILSKDWDFFVALFDEAGEGKLGKRPYWIDHTQDKIIMAYVQLYFYDSGYNYGSKRFDDDEAPILLKMDYWISDSGFNEGGTY